MTGGVLFGKRGKSRRKNGLWKISVVSEVFVLEEDLEGEERQMRGRKQKSKDMVVNECQPTGMGVNKEQALVAIRSSMICPYLETTI